jgi:hypothetical protein
MSLATGQSASNEVSDSTKVTEQPDPSTAEQNKSSGNRSLGLRAFLGRALATDTVQLTLLASTFLILKVLLVAKGDISVGLAVLQTSPTVTVIIGVILSALPIIGAVVIVVILYGLGCGVWGWKSLRDPIAILISVAALTAWILLTPWPVFALTFLGLLAGILDKVFWGRKARREGNGISFTRVRFVVVAVLCIFALIPVGKDIAYAMWLPREELHFQRSAEPATQPQGQQEQIIVGYVLGERGGWASVLTSGDRTIKQLESNTITSRQVCRNSKNYRESVAEYIRRKRFHYVNDMPFCNLGG